MPELDLRDLRGAAANFSLADGHSRQEPAPAPAPAPADDGR